MVVERFVETRSAFEWGLVCHALCGAMRELLDDWRLLVTQLEHQFLAGRLNLPVRFRNPDFNVISAFVKGLVFDSTVQTLWYHCQKPLTSLQLVASLAGEAAARKLRGAGLLNLLHQKSAAVTGTCLPTGWEVSGGSQHFAHSDQMQAMWRLPRWCRSCCRRRRSRTSPCCSCGCTRAC